MLNRSIVAGLVFVLLMNVGITAFANPPLKNKAASTYKAKAAQLISHLPESDAIATADIKRLFESGLSTLFAGNDSLLTKINHEVDKLEKGTGIDIRKFDLLVAGISSIKVKENEYDFHPLIIVRGSINSSDILTAAKKAANNKYKEETIGNRSFLIFKTEELAEDAIKSVSESESSLAKQAVKRISNEIAVTVLDSGTIAFGEPSRVRLMIEGRSKVSAEVVNLLNRTPFALANIAAIVPHGMSSILPLDDDELGQNLDSIKHIFGSMDVNESGAKFNLTVKTAQNAQASTLFDLISGMKSIGAGILGSSTREDQKLYAKVINHVKVTRSGSEVTFDLNLPQADVNALSALIK